VGLVLGECVGRGVVAVQTAVSSRWILENTWIFFAAILSTGIAEDS
jgi:hypothetical protein